MSRELVLVVDALAHEKGVSKEIVFKALEQALASAICKHLHANIDVEVAIDQEKGASTRLGACGRWWTL